MHPIFELINVVSKQQGMRRKRLLSYLDKIVTIDEQKEHEIKRLRASNEALNQRAQKAEQKYIQLKKKQVERHLG